MTLRAALLLVVVLAGLSVTLLLVLGIAGTACIAALCLLLQLALPKVARPQPA